EEQDENESPSFFFGTNPTRQTTGFQFGGSPTIPSKPETVNSLSNMIAKFDFNVSSSFSFGLQPTTDTKDNKLSIYNSIDKVKEHLKNDEQSIERAIKLLEDIWNDNSVLQNDSSSVA
ncbi:unnamed protein product, partial [Rotaria magnacalcarata]